MALAFLGAVGEGNWTEFNRLLGRRGGVEAEQEGVLVGGESTESSFAIRLRCLSHGMLLHVRAHALRVINKAFGKGERMPLVSLSHALVGFRPRLVIVANVMAFSFEHDFEGNDCARIPSFNLDRTPKSSPMPATVIFSFFSGKWKVILTIICVPNIGSLLRYGGI